MDKEDNRGAVLQTRLAYLATGVSYIKNIEMSTEDHKKKDVK